MNRTRQALRSALTKLVMERRFDQVTVADIVAQANVGRSTFYLHFKSKEDVLKSVMEGMMRDLATTASNEVDGARVRGLIGHFWRNRRLGNAVFGGSVGSHLRRSLAGMIADNIRANRTVGQLSEAAIRLRAIQIAAGQIYLLQSWLNGEVAADPDEVVAELRNIAAPRAASPDTAPVSPT